MSIYLLWLISGLLFISLEFFTPLLFFINLGLACIIVGLLAFLGLNVYMQIFCFIFFSILGLKFVRPWLKKYSGIKTKENSVLGEKYINQRAESIETITPIRGRIKIYGEEWQARSKFNEEIPKGESVKILSNDSIIMIVEKYKGEQ